MMVFFQLFICFWRIINQYLLHYCQYSAPKHAIARFSLILVVLPGFVLANSNYFLESQIAADIKLIERSNAIVQLKIPEKPEVLALYSESKTANLQGGAIILSDLYQTPDWPVIVHRLRKTLPDFGWETLSVQLPIPVSNPTNEQLDETYELTRQRIDAAVAFFKDKNISNVVLIGIRQSANFAINYVQSLPKENEDIQALISISAYDSQWLESSMLVKNISTAMLDLYAEHDLDVVLKSASKRLVAANFAGKLKAKPRFLKLSSKVQKLAIKKTGNLRYRQKMINGANFRFDEQEGPLIKAIRGWLSVYASGQEITVE